MHRPASATWLESSHQAYMSKQKNKGMRREVSWSEVELPNTNHQPTKSLPTIEETGDTILEEAAQDQPVLTLQDHDDKLPELPPDDPPSMIEDEPPSLPLGEPPSLPLGEPPSMTEDETVPPYPALSEDRPAEFLKEETEPPLLPHGQQLHEEAKESFQDEPPVLPQNEPPQLSFDDSEGEELAPVEAQPRPLIEGGTVSEQHIKDPVHPYSEDPSCVSNTDESVAPALLDTTVTVIATPETEVADLTDDLPLTNGLTAEPLSKPVLNELDEHESFQLNTSFDQGGIEFTISLKKWFRGLGFMLDKERSIVEGEKV